MSKVRLGIIGVGNMGSGHYEKIMAGETPEIELVAVADLRETDGTHKEKTYNLTNAEVFNSTGLELPSTGGTGRTIIFTAGTILAMVFAVLLITHKKMSIYTD